MLSTLGRWILDHAPAPIRHGIATTTLIYGMVTGTVQVTGYSLGMLAANIAVQVISTIITVVWIVTLVKAARYDQAVWDRTGHNKAMWMFILAVMPVYGIYRFWQGSLGWVGGAQHSLHFDLMRARADLLTGYTVAVEKGIPDLGDPALYALTPQVRAQVNQDLGYPAYTGPLSPPAQDPAAGADQDWQRSVYRPPAPLHAHVQEPPR